MEVVSETPGQEEFKVPRKAAKRKMADVEKVSKSVVSTWLCPCLISTPESLLEPPLALPVLRSLIVTSPSGRLAIISCRDFILSTSPRALQIKLER